MNISQTFDLWNYETGITDLHDDWNLLSDPLIPHIKALWEQERELLKDTDQLDLFNKRLAREWAIETGVIEDVFHIDRGVTANLIEQGISAALLEHGSVNKPVEYVIDILKDHLSTLDWLMERFVIAQNPLTIGAIKELHALMTGHQSHVDAQDDQGRPTRIPLIQGDWKKLPNNALREGILYRYCPPEQVSSEMERLIEIHCSHKANQVPIEVQSAWLHHRFTQIHPFMDGNGRVARALASLVFMKSSLFPLVVTRDMRDSYIGALEQADKGELKPLIDIFAEAQKRRFDKALKIIEELTHPPQTLDAAIENLKLRFHQRSQEVVKKQTEAIKDIAILEGKALETLEHLANQLKPIAVQTSHSNKDNSHFYRYQIISEARRLGYFANTSIYSSWIKLSLTGDIQAQLILSFHARGIDFQGVLICLPIFEIIYLSEEETRQRDLIPIVDKPFEFYYTEQADAVVLRFEKWLEEILIISVSQYQRLID